MPTAIEPRRFGKHKIYITSYFRKWENNLLAAAVQIQDVIDKNEHFHLQSTPFRQRLDRGQGIESNYLNPPGTKGFGTHTKHQGGGVEKDPPPSISRTRNATNLKPLEGLGVSFKVSKNFKLV